MVETDHTLNVMQYHLPKQSEKPPDKTALEQQEYLLCRIGTVKSYSQEQTRNTETNKQLGLRERERILAELSLVSKKNNPNWIRQGQRQHSSSIPTSKPLKCSRFFLKIKVAYTCSLYPQVDRRGPNNFVVLSPNFQGFPNPALQFPKPV